MVVDDSEGPADFDVHINDVDVPDDVGDSGSSGHDGDDDNDYDDNGSDAERSDIRVAKLDLVIKAPDILRYWDAKPNKRRKFVAGMVGADWPRMYGCPCAVVVDKYNYVQVVGSQKRSSKFGTVRGTCKICSATHLYEIHENPFEEIITKDHLIAYKPVFPLLADLNWMKITCLMSQSQNMI